MGTQGTLYKAAQDFIDMATAWQKECSDKPNDANCAGNLAALRKHAFKTAEWCYELSDPNSIEEGEKNYQASWRMYSELFNYHGACFDRYDAPECKAWWVAQDKERTRIWKVYGPEPRWRDFPDALRHQTFKP
jgi:hypothetical protein